MSPKVLFEVSARTVQSGVVKFNDAKINFGGGWVNKQELFDVNITRIYYISFSIGVDIGESNKDITAYVNINNHRKNCAVKFSGQSREKRLMDTISRGCLLLLNETNMVSLAINTAKHDEIYFSSCGITSFRGFLYSPLHNVKVTWSVHNSNQSVQTFKNNMLHFTEVLVNTDDVWNTTTNSISITISGAYYHGGCGFFC